MTMLTSLGLSIMQRKKSLAFEVSIIVLLLFLHDEVHSVAIVRHSMNKVRDTIAHLTSRQVPVITTDQSIYALIKQIQ